MNIYAFNNLFLGTSQKKYVKNAIKELRKIDDGVKVIDRFPAGVFTFGSSYHREVLIFKLQENFPIFLRHIHPIDRVIFIPRQTPISQVVKEGIFSLSDKIKAGKKVAVQVRRIPGEYPYTLYSIKKAIDPVLKETYKVTPTVKSPDQIISIFISDSTGIDINKCVAKYERDVHKDGELWSGVCFIGISTPKENLCEWAGGEVRFAREEEQKTSAEHKLLEAFVIFNIKPVKNGKALDLGASPGGWTRILHQKGYQVTAVDRAPLDKDIMRLKGVRFIQRDALRFRDDPNKYDIITNDINGDPIKSAKALVSLASSLRKGKPFIMTIKLTNKRVEKTIEKTISVLKKAYKIEKVRQMYHNRDEVTVYGINR